MESRHGLGYEKACRLSNTGHSEILPTLSLPSLSLFFGSADQRIRLSDEPSDDGDRSADRPEILYHASTMADCLRNCDVSYLNLNDGLRSVPDNSEGCSVLYNEVLKYYPEAFECCSPGPLQEQGSHNQVKEEKLFAQNVLNFGQAERGYGDIFRDHLDKDVDHDPPTSAGSKKLKHKKKTTASVPLSTTLDLTDRQDMIGNFCELLEDLCGRAEMPDEVQGTEGSYLPLSDIKLLVNEILSLRTKKVLQLVPHETLVRLLNVLDRQIQFGHGLSIDENDNPDSDISALVLCALESTHAALAIMTNQDMPKQLYKEEIIERIIDFSRHAIMESMAAFNPSHRTFHKPSENGGFDGDEDEDDDIGNSSVGRKRRNIRNVNMKKFSANKVSAVVSSVLQKLCTILGFLKDLLSVERLSDTCILQLVKTSFSTFLVDHIQPLQLKSINLICGVFASYSHHRSFLIDETIQLLRKQQFSKHAVRAYHLPDEEQKQIQMITALLIQLVQFSANLPEKLKTTSDWSIILDASIDTKFPIQCHEAASEASCLFWTSVLQRFTAAKAQDASESKVIVENLVMDLLTTLNLPEYPASAHILEVLCVLLLQNAGLKSKDVSARCVAIDLLGTIAARLKRDAVICKSDKFWILNDQNDNSSGDEKDICSVCFNGRGINVVCHSCQRCFHGDCIGVAREELLLQDWSCHICLCRNQLIVLQSCCKLQSKDKNSSKKSGANGNASGRHDSISGMEVIQQILLNHLQEAGPQDDANLFTRWFYLCLWSKNESLSQDRVKYYLAKLKSKALLKDSGSALLLSRDWAKKLCLALGQKNSFTRGFDTILTLLLVTLRESSPILRAKALRGVSAIVEADPDVLCDKRIQCAVEDRFCDSAISVREAALELVGRHIASHPDVGLKYFDKVAERIKDTGVSVRKRAIKIIRDLCTSNPNFPRATNAFIVIISRVSDEESSIQDLVCKTFYELWFEEPSGRQTFAGDGSSVPTEIAKKTEEIVDMLRKMSNHQLLVTIVKRNLSLDFLSQSAKATGMNAVLLATVRQRCELICKRLLERILQIEDRSSNDEEVHALPYVMALHAFCVVDPMLCVPATDPSQFVVTLQPYLKNQVDNKSIAKLIESIIFVVDAVLPLLRKPPQSVIEELEQDLKHMIVRHSFQTVVHACVKCLCSLSKIAGNSAILLEYLIQFFFKQLHGTTANNNQLQRLGRSLFCLGLLLRYGNELLVNYNGEGSHIEKSLPLLKKYLLSEDIGLKARALQALGSILIARPEYMLEKDIGKIIEASLSYGAASELKMQVLLNLYDYLLDAESQLDGISKTATQNPQDADSRVPDAAGAGDTNICGGIIQLFWDSILERCLDVDDNIRPSALKIVEIVLRQGLVHPITCVPYLVALENDPHESNSKLAHHLLMNMNEKYPAFFESRLGDGLLLTFRFIQSITKNHNTLPGNVRGKSEDNTVAYIRRGISRIYRLIRGNRVSRNKFIHSIVRKFESGSGSWNQSSVAFLIYCAQILSSLPFVCPDEPLYLIYDINRVIQLRAGAVEANMKIWSSFSQQQASSELPDGEDKVESGSMSNNLSDHNVSETKEAVPSHSFSISEEDLQKIQADCHAAIALQLLLKLKRHLKIVYGLNDACCQAFSIKEHPKSGETISKQNIPFNISDTPISLPTSYGEMVEKYQEFKASLKEDTHDYATYTSSIKRKRPTPRSARSGKAAKDGGDDSDDNEEWTGGPRKLDFSNQKVVGSSSRVTRQRLKV